MDTNHEHMLVFIKPKRENFMASMSEQEEALMKGHANYFQKLVADGVVFVAGPVLDDQYGMAVFNSPDKPTVEAFLNQDPCIVAGIMDVHMHPFRLSMMGRHNFYL